MDGSKMLIGCCDNLTAVLNLCQVGLHKIDWTGLRMEGCCHRVTALCVSPTQDQPCCAALDEQTGNGFTQPLATACHDRILTSKRSVICHGYLDVQWDRLTANIELYILQNNRRPKLWLTASSGTYKIFDRWPSFMTRISATLERL
jgi:hypothetical protein